MKVTVYLKKSSPEASNICFRVRDKNVDIKVVSPLEVQDRYWDTDTLSYRRTTAVPAAEQKRLPEQIAAIIERAEKTFTDKADSRWMRQVIEDVLYPARAFERNHPNLLARVHEYGDTGRDGLHPLRGDRHAGADERFPGLCGERTPATAGISRLLRSPPTHQPQTEAAFRYDRHQHHEPFLHLPALVQEDEVFRQRGLCPLRLQGAYLRRPVLPHFRREEHPLRCGLERLPEVGRHPGHLRVPLLCRLPRG